MNGHTDGHVYIDSAIDADQEYINFMGSMLHTFQRSQSKEFE